MVGSKRRTNCVSGDWEEKGKYAMKRIRYSVALWQTPNRVRWCDGGAFVLVLGIMREMGMEQEEKVLDGTRTRNLPLRRRMPYPLGHEDTMLLSPPHFTQIQSTSDTSTTNTPPTISTTPHHRYPEEGPDTPHGCRTAPNTVYLSTDMTSITCERRHRIRHGHAKQTKQPNHKSNHRLTSRCGGGGACGLNCHNGTKK